MRIGIPTWSGAVSPVFDVAQRLLVVDIGAGKAVHRFEEPLAETRVLARSEHLAGLGVEVLICGAISWAQEQSLASRGIRVVSHVCGGVEDVLSAYIAGNLVGDVFRMPGCRNCRHQWRHGGGRRGLRPQGGVR
jgi:predicted Fe-Mo cluster-binding NifX family protein